MAGARGRGARGGGLGRGEAGVDAALGVEGAQVAAAVCVGKARFELAVKYIQQIYSLSP